MAAASARALLLLMLACGCSSASLAPGLSEASRHFALASTRGAPPRGRLDAPAQRTSLPPQERLRSVASLRGGFVGHWVRAATRVTAGVVGTGGSTIWRLIKLQALVVLLATVWPIPLVIFFYWLMYTWFGCEGTSMIAFTGLR